MLILQRLAKVQSVLAKQILNRPIFLVHHQGQLTPKQHRLPWKPQQKAILYRKGTRIIPKIDMEYQDPIVLPGYDDNNIGQLLIQFQQRKLPLSATTLCMLIHMFTKYSVMTEEAFGQIQKQAHRLKGEYKTRSIFGAIQGCLIYNRRGLLAFFLSQYKAATEKFTMSEILQTMEAVIRNKTISQQYREAIWGVYFKNDFLDGFQNIKITNTQWLVRIFDMFVALKLDRRKAWSRLLLLMQNKKGWARIPVIERLYSISGENPLAKKIFDKYFESMSQDQAILQRYNLTELRYHTPLQIIKYIEQNPSDYYPKIRTLIPEEQNAEQWNQRYEQYLKVGAVKEEEQIIKDKSKSLGFAIRQRYETMEEDNIEFSKMSKEQFQEMFGNYDETMQTIKQEDIKIAERQKQQAEKSEKQQQDAEQEKGKKAKGKQKTGKEGKGEKPVKEKKEKAKVEQ